MVLSDPSVTLCVTKKIKNLHRVTQRSTARPDLSSDLHRETQSCKVLILNVMNRLFAISDIHGCFKPFYELVVNIIKLKKSDHLMLLGDYIDRGQQSKEVIDFIIDLQKKGYNITPLAGNHELMLMNSYSDPDMLPFWLMNNGMSTLQSFGIDDILEIDKHYLDFFNSLSYYRIIGKLVFVHAGFNDLAEDPFSDKYSLVWESSGLLSESSFGG